MVDDLVGAFRFAVFFMAGGVVPNPLDIRFQRVSGLAATIETNDDLGPVDMARAIYAEGGVAAFFDGAGERVLYWAPAIGLFLTAYCRFRHWLL